VCGVISIASVSTGLWGRGLSRGNRGRGDEYLGIEMKRIPGEPERDHAGKLAPRCVADAAGAVRAVELDTRALGADGVVECTRSACEFGACFPGRDFSAKRCNPTLRFYGAAHRPPTSANPLVERRHISYGLDVVHTRSQERGLRTVERPCAEPEALGEFVIDLLCRERVVRTAADVFDSTICRAVCSSSAVRRVPAY